MNREGLGQGYREGERGPKWDSGCGEDASDDFNSPDMNVNSKSRANKDVMLDLVSLH